MSDRPREAAMSLADFLLAQIAKDAAEARADAGGGLFIARDTGSQGDAWLSPVRDYDPAHVLADCEAKRLTVRFLSDLERGEFGDVMSASIAYSVLCRMATVYAERPDYEQEWQP